MSWQFNGTNQYLEFFGAAPGPWFGNVGGAGWLAWAKPGNTTGRLSAFGTDYHTGAGLSQNNFVFVEFNGPSFGYSPSIYTGAGSYPSQQNSSMTVGRDFNPAIHYVAGTWYGVASSNKSVLGTAPCGQMAVSGVNSNAAFNDTGSVSSAGVPLSYASHWFGADNTGSTPSQFFPGEVARCALWWVQPSARSLSAMVQGICPMWIQTAAIRSYIPLIRETFDFFRRGTWTNHNASAVSSNRQPRCYGR